MQDSKFQVRIYGHSDLRVKAKAIDSITPEIVEICERMVETMVSMDNCIGFAGPQLGILLRVFVIREEKFLPDNKFILGEPEVIINPVLSSPSKTIVTMEEGCMSLPGLHVKVDRPQSIRARYQNVKGEFIEEELHDFRARMFMHENDHLNGVLIIDRMDPKERKKIEPILRSMKSQSNS
jgi:peptide deformylase